MELCLFVRLGVMAANGECGKGKGCVACRYWCEKSNLRWRFE
jgi:hypothetical protein